MKKTALTLPGGGARAAYQVGVLRGISDICHFKESPFHILSGVSAGAINTMWVAGGSEDFDQCTKKLWELWKNLSVSDVYKTDALTLIRTGGTWLRNLSLGEWFGKSHITYLLDTSPLAKLLHEEVDFPAIQKNLDSGLVYGLSVTATDYHLASGVSFFTGHKDIQPWAHTLSLGRRDVLTVDHVLASAAIPIFFPPVRLHGRDYGDGGIGLKTPLSPAVHMGASRILVIGVENPPKFNAEQEVEALPHATLGDVAGTLLNALFLSSLDADIDRLKKTNHTASIFTPEQIKSGVTIRNIPLLVIRPSRDLRFMGPKELENFPFTVRHLLKGLGIDNEKGWNLLSYLAFDKAYSAALLELGYNDAMAQKKEILKFFADEVDA